MKETIKVTNEMREALRKPLPKEAIKAHPTKTFLSSIKAIYVTERMNEVFGVGGWQIKVDPLSVSDKGMVVVKVVYTVPEYNIYYECFGGNDNGGENSKNFDLGDAYKGATTDALTKIGSYLEIGIDVFKGISSHNDSGKGSTTAKTVSTPAPSSDKPKSTTIKSWLNEKTPQYTQALEALKVGTKTVEDLTQLYNISKAVRAKLEEASKA